MPPPSEERAFSTQHFYILHGPEIKDITSVFNNLTCASRISRCGPCFWRFEPCKLSAGDGLGSHSGWHSSDCASGRHRPRRWTRARSRRLSSLPQSHLDERDRPNDRQTGREWRCTNKPTHGQGERINFTLWPANFDKKTQSSSERMHTFFKYLMVNLLQKF